MCLTSHQNPCFQLLNIEVVCCKMYGGSMAEAFSLKDWMEAVSNFIFLLNGTRQRVRFYALKWFPIWQAHHEDLKAKSKIQWDLFCCSTRTKLVLQTTTLSFKCLYTVLILSNHLSLLIGIESRYYLRLQ